MNDAVKTYDIDGVINLDEFGVGIRPSSERDIIITGRSYQEAESTLRFLHTNNIKNQVFFNPVLFDEKTRESSGWHKARTINMLKDLGSNIVIHFEDDPVQADIIENNTTVTVIRVNHNNLIELENVKR
jgi:hypothetical protein